MRGPADAARVGKTLYAAGPAAADPGARVRLRAGPSREEGVQASPRSAHGLCASPSLPFLCFSISRCDAVPSPGLCCAVLCWAGLAWMPLRSHLVPSSHCHHFHHRPASMALPALRLWPPPLQQFTMLAPKARSSHGTVPRRRRWPPLPRLDLARDIHTDSAGR